MQYEFADGFRVNPILDEGVGAAAEKDLSITILIGEADRTDHRTLDGPHRAGSRTEPVMADIPPSRPVSDLWKS